MQVAWCRAEFHFFQLSSFSPYSVIFSSSRLLPLSIITHHHRHTSCDCYLACISNASSRERAELRKDSSWLANAKTYHRTITISRVNAAGWLQRRRWNLCQRRRLHTTKRVNIWEIQSCSKAWHSIKGRTKSATNYSEYPTPRDLVGVDLKVSENHFLIFLQKCAGREKQRFRIHRRGLSAAFASCVVAFSPSGRLRGRTENKNILGLERLQECQRKGRWADQPVGSSYKYGKTVNLYVFMLMPISDFTARRYSWWSLIFLFLCSKCRPSEG